MHPLVKAAPLLLGLLATSALDGWMPRTDVSARQQVPTRLVPVACPPGTLPEGEHCLPLPGTAPQSPRPLPEASSSPERSEDVELIARRPERPREAQAYRWPFEPQQVLWASPPAATGTGALLGGARLVGERGTLVPLIALQGQEGDATVVFVGELAGSTVITRHSVRVAGRAQRILLVHSGLEGTTPGLLAGTELTEGEPLGTVGVEGLDLAARELRETVDLDRIAPRRLLDPSVSAPSDLRNVLQVEDAASSTSL